MGYYVHTCTHTFKFLKTEKLYTDFRLCGMSVFLTLVLFEGQLYFIVTYVNNFIYGYLNDHFPNI